jgi:hypothetical protein
MAAEAESPNSGTAAQAKTDRTITLANARKTIVILPIYTSIIL